MKRKLAYLMIVVLLITLFPLSTLAAETYLWPVNGGGNWLSQSYSSSHNGIDIAAAKGTPIHATKSGKVVVVYTGCLRGNQNCATECSPQKNGVASSYYTIDGIKYCNYGFGNGVIIKHYDGTYSQYAHLLPGSITVSYGDTVMRGQQIGKVGSSGASTGYHLHFSLSTGTSASTCFNNNTSVISYSKDTSAYFSSASHAYDSSGKCTKCGEVYNWGESLILKTVTLRPAAGKTGIELKNIPYGAGTVVKGPYNTIQARGTVVNHYTSLWYVVTVNGVDYYVFSDNVVATVPTPTVSFNANGGSVGTSSKTVTYGSSYGTLPTPTRAGYNFNGWYTAQTGGNKITSSTTVSNTSNHTLYAQWTLLNYTVSFNANGGSVSTSSKSVTYSSTYGTLPTPSRTGYTFNGWYTASSGGSQITSGSTVTKTASHTLYAQWTPLSYTATFNANGGSVSTSNKTITYGSTYGTLPTPTQTGYTFNGWYTAQTGGSKITSSTTVSNASNHTLYAQWSLVTSGVSVGDIERLSANRVSSTSIKLTWRKAANATGYHIYRSTSADGTYVYLRTIYTSSYSYMVFTNTGLVRGRTYYYKVLAFNKIGTTVTKGNMSNYVFAKTY